MFRLCPPDYCSVSIFKNGKPPWECSFPPFIFSYYQLKSRCKKLFNLLFDIIFCSPRTTVSSSNRTFSFIIHQLLLPNLSLSLSPSPFLLLLSSAFSGRNGRSLGVHQSFSTSQISSSSVSSTQIFAWVRTPFFSLFHLQTTTANSWIHLNEGGKDWSTSDFINILLLLVALTSDLFVLPTFRYGIFIFFIPSFLRSSPFLPVLYFALCSIYLLSISCFHCILHKRILTASSEI